MLLLLFYVVVWTDNYKNSGNLSNNAFVNMWISKNFCKNEGRPVWIHWT